MASTPLNVIVTRQGAPGATGATGPAGPSGGPAGPPGPPGSDTLSAPPIATIVAGGWANLAGLAEGSTVRPTGYYVAGDWQVPEYIVNSSYSAYPHNGGTILVVGSKKLIAKMGPVVDVRAFGAKGDGVQDDTVYIQNAVDWATRMFDQAAYPPAGAVFNPTTVLFPHGSYRITSTLTIYTGLTVKGVSDMAYTVSSCRIIMDTNSGTNSNRDKHIFSLTGTYNGAFRNVVTNNISELEFWHVNPGATMTQRTGSNWQARPGNNPGDNYGLYGGCSIFVGESCIDLRVRRCSFYQTPDGAIVFNRASGASSNYFNAFIEDCEFDTPVSGVRANNCKLDLVISRCEFSGNYYSVLITNSTGNLVFRDNHLLAGGQFVVHYSSRLDAVQIQGNNVTFSSQPSWLHLENAVSAIITGNSFGGAGPFSGLNIVNCDSGVIANNHIRNSGYNATANGPTTDPGAIRLVSCINFNVMGNTIATPAPASYNGFGILTLDGPRASRCLVSNNIISNQYNALGYRSQPRALNVGTGDISLNNQVWPVS
jgi:Pectate lyase superfamily protein